MSGKIEYLKQLTSLLPEKPGIYQYFDKSNKIIYIGKAKNLKKRVASYFTKNQVGKTALLVNNIVNIEHLVVETEQDALLLENNLIKKYQPKYNILLKDDKTYPWIVVKKEPFPRVFQTRTVIQDGSLYFGPFTSVLVVRTLLTLFRKIYKLRTCSLNLSAANIKKGKYKICLEYHIGNCLSPCIGTQNETDYLVGIDQINDILKGNIQSVIRYLKSQMKNFAENYQFEEAAIIKDRLDHLEKFQSKSTVVSSTITNVDVFGIYSDEKAAYVNYLKVINGAIIQTFQTELKKVLDESDEQLLAYAIVDIRQKIFSNAKELLVPVNPEIELDNVSLKTPERGDKKKLLDLAMRNAKYFGLERLKQASVNKKNFDKDRVLKKIKEDLQLKELPVHIECFDNSNLQGTNPVSSCVVFRNGKPAKRDYRHFNVKTVEGPNDFASMTEVVHRRYKRLIEEKQNLPQLIIVDGGKGQLSAAVEALEMLQLRGKVAIIGIAKRLEEIYYPDDSVPLYLDKNSETLKVIQHARDEAHRFGITFHRQKRSSNFIHSQLENIPGIGKKTITLLLNEFKSVENLKNAPYDTIAQKIGHSKATKLTLFFNSTN